LDSFHFIIIHIYIQHANEQMIKMIQLIDHRLLGLSG